MPWPTDDLSTEHLDAGVDSPANARSMIKKVIDYLKAILAARGTAGGFCELDAEAKVPGTRIGRGAADGVAPLDAASKLPRSHLPDATAAEAGAVRLATDAEVENASGTGTLQARQLARRTATQNRAGTGRTLYRCRNHNRNRHRPRGHAQEPQGRPDQPDRRRHRDPRLNRGQLYRKRR